MGFVNNSPADFLLDYYGFNKSFLPEIRDTFSNQGLLKKEVAEELGLTPNIPITYRAGDQPNNAFSLNVLEPGEIATTAGTSGVVYGIVDNPSYDMNSRVNTFVHVNHQKNSQRFGILLCLNGTGILNRWLKQNIVDINNCEVPYKSIDDDYVNKVPVGCDGLAILPYGNGAERTLVNKNIGSSMHNIDFNRHTRAHMLRAGQEGIVFALNYGIDIMKSMGMKMNKIKAGYANMFLSPVFVDTFANVSNATIELYTTDGSEGAARGAGVGAGIYKDFKEAFGGLEKKKVIEPNAKEQEKYLAAYENWLNALKKEL